MLSLATAKRLREAGLNWQPAELDFFAVPLPDLDEHIFVVSSITVMAEPIQKQLALTFHGVTEWALDHVWAGEAIWLPSEEQLREAIEERLIGQPDSALTLTTTPLGYRCDLHRHGQTHSFADFEASEAYAAALLQLLVSN
ncbi:MAG: hypothetical protein J5I90_22595 [Caldilineales bacterium]|nr:hypothetical protein [Caldilineales bacterium]